MDRRSEITDNGQKYFESESKEDGVIEVYAEAWPVPNFKADTTQQCGALALHTLVKIWLRQLKKGLPESKTKEQQKNTPAQAGLPTHPSR